MGVKVVSTNKKARHDYFINDTFEAGIVLKGSEVKSIRLGNANINDSYVIIKNNELFLINSHVSKFDQSSIFNHDEKRNRKLLMHHKQINKLKILKEKEGITIVPLKLYFKEGLCKVEIATCKGKKNYDKRQALKEKTQDMKIKKILNKGAL